MSAKKKATEETKDTAEAAEAAAEELAAVQEEAATAAEGRRLDEIIHSLQELGKVAGRAGETLRANVKQAPDAVRDGIAQTEEKIRERPLASMGIAAGVGLLLGLLLNRRH